MAILGGMKMSLSMILKGQFIFVSIQAPYSYEKICYKKWWRNCQTEMKTNKEIYAQIFNIKPSFFTQ